MKRIFLFSILVIVLASSCDQINRKRVSGNGNVQTQNRELGSFSGIDVDNALSVTLKQDATQSVRIEADENLQKYIHVEVKDGILHVWQENNTSISPSKKIKVFVSAPTINKLDVSGASELLTDGRLTATSPLEIDLSGASSMNLDIKAPSVNIDVEGASGLTIRGETRDLDADASGASTIRAYDLLAENTKADASGASHADVFASVKIEADASGASGIRYKGNATVNNVHESGAGSVKKVD